MAAKIIPILVGISLGLLSQLYCANAADIQDGVVTKTNSGKRQTLPDTTCLTNAMASSQVLTCATAIASDINSRCTSVCNSLYTATLDCYGATVTEAYYRALCTNGYMGGSSGGGTGGGGSGGAAKQLNFNFAVLLMSALIATLFRIVA